MPDFVNISCQINNISKQGLKFGWSVCMLAVTNTEVVRSKQHAPITRI